MSLYFLIVIHVVSEGAWGGSSCVSVFLVAEKRKILIREAELRARLGELRFDRVLLWQLSLEASCVLLCTLLFAGCPSLAAGTVREICGTAVVVKALPRWYPHTSSAFLNVELVHPAAVAQKRGKLWIFLFTSSRDPDFRYCCLNRLPVSACCAAPW